MWKYYALLSALFASLTAIFSKVGVEGINSSLATAIRVTFIMALVWGVVLFSNALREIGHIPGRGWLFLLLSAISTGLSWLFYFRALESGDVSRVAPLDKLSVPITIILAIVFLGEGASWKVLAGGCLITFGSLLLLM